MPYKSKQMLFEDIYHSMKSNGRDNQGFWVLINEEGRRFECSNELFEHLFERANLKRKDIHTVFSLTIEKSNLYVKTKNGEYVPCNDISEVVSIQEKGD